MMKKTLSVLALCAMVLAFAGCAAIDETSATGSTPVPSATHAPKPTATATHVPTWTTIETFSGNGNKKTDSFTVPRRWRLLWSCEPNSFYFGQYAVSVQVYTTAGRYVDLAVNSMCQKGNVGDTTQEYTGGELYLDVSCVAKWQLVIQVLR